MSATLLFVYGSLKHGHVHHPELSPPGHAAASFVGAAVTQARWRLFQVGHYPALADVASPAGGGGGEAAAPGDHIEGELYWVSARLLAELDRFEECPQLYQRVALQVLPASQVAPSLTAQTYVMSALQIERLLLSGAATRLERAYW